ncbi:MULTISPECIES: hypothetical protein [unclassified Bifidobacterium]|uniref:hypothetical protein n=1 Tax=unclassified Bifidobacterium TaxID=2608897 RepID=UPI00112E6E70|nr:MULTISPECIES: hypothetical protein [unclassified Bifidobacterium]
MPLSQLPRPCRLSFAVVRLCLPAVPFNVFFTDFGVEWHDDASLPPHHLFDVLSKGPFSNDFEIASIAVAAPAAVLSATQRGKSPKSR